MKDALETLGQIIDGDEGRDAVHIAVISVKNTLQMTLSPGQNIRVDNDGLAPILYGDRNAIVDPFLKDSVKTGEFFWAFLYPRTTEGLRHVWKHPDFDESNELYENVMDTIAGNQPARKFLEEVARGIGEEVEVVISNATDFQYNGTTWNGGDNFMDAYADDEFWDAWQKVTGKTAKDRSNFFRCAC